MRSKSRFSRRLTKPQYSRLVQPERAERIKELGARPLECIFEVLFIALDCLLQVDLPPSMNFGSFHHFRCLTLMSLAFLFRMHSDDVAAKVAGVVLSATKHWWLLAEMANLLGIEETVFDAFLGGLAMDSITWTACGLGVGTFRAGRNAPRMKYVYILSGGTPSYGMSTGMERERRPDFGVTNRAASNHRRSLANAAAAAAAATGSDTTLPPQSTRRTRTRRSSPDATDTERTTATEAPSIPRAPPPLLHVAGVTAT